MTTSTSDAEAIARIIDPNAFRGAFLSTQPSLSKDRARAKAAAILSYLASRREAQEPVAWMSDADPAQPFIKAYHKDAMRPEVAERYSTALYTAPPAPAGEVERLTPNERFIPRMLLLDDLHAVCVGGRWDGWKFFKHPDGQWVSLKKLEEQGADDAARAALNGGRE